MKGIFDVNVKVPAEFTAAAKNLPEFSRVADRFAASMERSNVTIQAVAVLVVFGAIVTVLLAGRK